jgi:DNA-binding SARP family transcriptional activator
MTVDEALALARTNAQQCKTEGSADVNEREQASGRGATSEASGMPPLRIQALGAVSVERGVHEVTSRDFTYGKARELLFYLLLHGPRTKQQIGVALWPDISEQQLQTTFRVVVYHLRQALGYSGRVIRERGRYALARSADDWYDVEAFESAVAEAERRLRLEPEKAIAHLETARSLYRGDLCENMAAGDWLIESQNELRRKQLFVLLSSGGACLERGQPRKALERFMEALKLDTYCEDAHRGVLRSYLLLQEHSQAARYYQQLRLRFERELGIAPAPETYAIIQSAY